MSKPLKKPSVGYLELCQHILDNNVPAKAVIKHRWLIHAIADQAREMPSFVDNGEVNWSMEFELRNRRLVFTFDKLSGRARLSYCYRIEADHWTIGEGQRPTLDTIPFWFAWIESEEILPWYRQWLAWFVEWLRGLRAKG